MAGIAIVLLVILTHWQATAQDATDPTAGDPAEEAPAPAEYTAGLWTMKVTDKAVWFEPPVMFEEHQDVEFDVIVEFCRAMQTVSGTTSDGEEYSYDSEYRQVPEEEGEQLAAQLFSGRLTAYPWKSATGAEDRAVPRTVLERSFLRMVLTQLEGKNDQVTDADWADPKNRLGILMHASGYVEVLSGPQIFKMSDTSFYIFPRKGAITVLCSDDYYTWTLRGDTSEEWPRGMQRDEEGGE